MATHSAIRLLFVSLPFALALACTPKKATTPSAAPASAPVAATEPEPPPPPPPKVPADAFSVGTFNADWALDDADTKRSSTGLKYRAKTREDWTWKRDSLAKILATEKLDIVALQELGGERELSDIAWAIKEQGGPQYDWVFVPSDDKTTGQHVGILSTLPISNARRLPVNMRKQMAADVELPSGNVITVVVAHARSGTYPAHGADRRKQARSIKKVLVKMAKSQPVLLLGTFNETSTSSDGDYAASSVGILAGANTSPPEDDCQDSGSVAGATTVDDRVHDRVFSCGLQMRNATVAGRDLIVRGSADPTDAPWSAIALEAEPHRDVSKHLVLWAEIALPKKPEPPTGEAPTDAAAGETEGTH